MTISALIPRMTTRTIRVGQREIHLAEIGQGPAVLMLHGGGPGASGISNYARNIEALASGYRVLVPDMPGYGKSTKGLDRADPFGDLATAMHGMLDALSISRVHAIGNSLGGACALRMALDRPARMGRLVLMGPGGVDTTRGLPTAGLKRLLDYYSGDGPTLEKLSTFIKGDLVYDGSLIPDDLIRERFQASIDPEVVAKPPLVRPKGLPKFSKIDFTRDARLQSLQNPTLVLWGTEDRVNRPSGGRSLQKRMPCCDLYLFSRTGHWVQWERASEFNSAVLEFLAQDTSAN
ncbi:MAG: alpha/beta fold hydrolase [Undibacterium sp.]|uniref:alpha/beta fold hydrolase n=1 Tax=Undibacterium sp. TaxID=1914977 RepID=UPI002715E4B4|nr:alpha/beta fold hydrolase [Undibacterium sp.]MDO8650926.1 alpha/beta fold hydrolase [Undibacterium sp.]